MHLRLCRHLKKTRRLLFLIIILLALGQCGLAQGGRSGDLYVDDAALIASFSEKLEEFVDNGKTTDMDVIRGQLRRGPTRIELPVRTVQEMTFPEVYAQSKRGVLAVGYLYKCTRCTKLHLNPSTGFVLTASGIIATAYHVVGNPTAEALGAMTFDGQVYTVKEVLAARKIDDIAILQLDGSGFQPLPLSPNASVGTPVAMIGHPSRQFYMLTAGVISRYFAQRDAGVEVRWLSATAEIGGGASGGPLLDTSGSVVGMASRTRPVFSAAHDHEPRRVQMVIRQYVPASVILELVTFDEGSAQEHPESAKQLINR